MEHTLKGFRPPTEAKGFSGIHRIRLHCKIMARTRKERNKLERDEGIGPRLSRLRGEFDFTGKVTPELIEESADQALLLFWA